MAQGDAVSQPTVTTGGSFGSVLADHPVMFTLAALAGAAVVAAAIVLGGSDSDEAPIRVKNGSLEFTILATNQQWEQSGTSGNWKINAGRRHRDVLDLLVAVRPGAACGGNSASSGEIILTYSNDKKIRIQSLSRHTWVKPDSGVTLTWDSATPQTLTYTAAGFLKSIETGNGSGGSTPMCSFTAANQLDQAIVLNIP